MTRRRVMRFDLPNFGLTGAEPGGDYSDARAMRILAAPILARVKAPTVLLRGERDGMIPVGNAAGYLRYLPHATLVRLPNLGHVPFEEDPAASPRPVERFPSGGAPPNRSPRPG